MNVEGALYGLVDQSDMMHALAKRMVEGYMSELDQLDEITGYDASNMEGFDTFKPPYDLLAKADLSKVEAACHTHRDKFIMAAWEPPMPKGECPHTCLSYSGI